jgi:hypothetical protein
MTYLPVNHGNKSCSHSKANNEHSMEVLRKNDRRQGGVEEQEHSIHVAFPQWFILFHEINQTAKVSNLVDGL